MISEELIMKATEKTQEVRDLAEFAVHMISHLLIFVCETLIWHRWNEKQP